VLGELAEKIDAARLVQAAEAEGESAVAQRLGYLLERMGAVKVATKLAKWLDRRSPKTVLLAPDKLGTEILRDARWRVIVNVELEPDQP
jgi:predicted transcriptional regulator of viral defense system